jgi:hypothetical protein
MLTFIRRLFCRHYRVEFVRNLYGDQINDWGGKRSAWCCTSCGAMIGGDYLHTESAAPTQERAR